MLVLLIFFLQSALEVTGGQYPEEKRETLVCSLKALFNIGVHFLSGSHSFQFTALALINKIIDVTIAENLVNFKCKDKIEQCPNVNRNGSNVKTSTTWKQVIQEGESCYRIPAKEVDESSKDNCQQQQRTMSELFCQKIHAGTTLSLILNAITLQRRVVGTRSRCTPSVRIRQCSYHCLQILSARLLLFLAQTVHSREQLMEEAQLRLVVEALDYTLDPQLLCLVIQTVAFLALHFPYHSVLLQSGIPDALTQLVLPSDEWYYTNHTTKFSRIVKYHAARALVYLGLARCLGPRVSLFHFQGKQASNISTVINNALIL